MNRFKRDRRGMRVNDLKRTKKKICCDLKALQKKVSAIIYDI
jgi:hypothetical protein